MQQLNVTIARTAGVLTLTPPVLNAFTGDQIFWINNDTKTHQPAALNPDGSNTPIVDPVGAGQTSNIFSPSPLFDTAGNPISYTINYICLDQPATKAEIAVTPNP